MPKVLNKTKDGEPTGAIYVGRPSKWGNPFYLRKEADRARILGQYRAWLLGQPALVDEAKRELAGADLVCWCAPKPCHADILLAVANGPAAGAVNGSGEGDHGKK